jgi:cytoskeleton protein RodZ
MGSFGERLQREREMRGITLEEIADSTKIGTRSLRALEEEDFGKLPGGIFNKGFVRAYARYLGIDEEQAVTDFLAAAGDAEPPLPNPSPTEKLTTYRSGSRGWVAALALVVLAVGGYGAWRLNLWPLAGSTARQTAPPVQPPPAIRPPVVAAATETGFVVAIRAKEDAWLSITADGQVVMEGTLPAAQTKEVRATKSVVLRLGNAAGVEVSHNNTLLPPLGGVNEVKTVVFTPEGLQP